MDYSLKNNSLIYLENVNINYGSFNALANINLEIQKGENWLILGANGSGKSTLVKIFTNDLYPVSNGDFKKVFFGRERWDIFDLKNKFGIITDAIQNDFTRYSPNITTEDVVLSGFYSSLGVYKTHKFTAKQLQKAKDVLNYLGIYEVREKHVKTLSTGILRRAIIGRSLIHDAEIFILDEPTVGLDLRAQHDFIEIIRKLAENHTIILITHKVEEIFPEITNIALIKNKTIYKQGLKKDILTSENLSDIFGINIELKEENGKYSAKVY